MSRLLLSCLVAGVFSATTVFAHHTTPGRVHPTVQITQQVLADGKPLAPGTYEIWITDERPDVGAGAPSENQRTVELVQNGKVVAREIAEVFPRAPREVVGTTGSAMPTTARVERLKEGDFIRVSINDPDGRFLIHLPTGRTSGPQ